MKGVKPGKATITVKAKRAGKYATKKVYVTVVAASKYKPVKKVYAKASKTSLTVGETAKVSYSFSPKYPSNRNVTFKSSNTKVLAVNASGKVTAKAAGTAKVTVTSCYSAKRYATVTIKVYAKPKGVSIDCASGLEVGEKVTAKASVSPSTALQSVTWKSSDASIATVSSKGVVTGISEGYVTITATSAKDPSKKASVQVAVAPVDSDDDGIPDEAEEKYLGTDPGEADADQAEDTIVYTDDAFEAEQDQVLSLEAERGASEVSAVLSELPEGAGEGSIVVIPGNGESPLGTAIQISSISQTAEGFAVSGTVPDQSEVYEFIYIDTEVDLSNAYIEPNDDWVLDDGETAQHLEASKPSYVRTDLGLQGDFSLKIPMGKGEGNLGVKVNADSARVAISQFGPVPTKAEIVVEGSVGPYFKGKLEGKVSGTMCIAIPGLSSGVTTWKGELGPKKKDANPAANGLYVDLGVEFSLAGQFGFECLMPYEVGATYYPVIGLRPQVSMSMGQDAPFDGLSVEAGMEAKVHGVVGPDLYIAGKSIIAVQASGGIDGKLDIEAHANPFMNCVSFGAWLGVDATATLLGDSDRWGLEIQKEIFTSANSPWKKVWHFDDGVYVGGDENCTWKSGGSGSPDPGSGSPDPGSGGSNPDDDSVEVPDIPGVTAKSTLEGYSWPELKAIANAVAAAPSDAAGLEIAKKYNLVGADGKLTGNETKEVVLSDWAKQDESSSDGWQGAPLIAQVQILGFRQDREADGSLTGITFGFKDIVGFHAMNAYYDSVYHFADGTTGDDSNAGGWANSQMRAWLNGGFYGTLPDSLQGCIVEVKKETNNQGYVGSNDPSVVSATEDKVWLLGVSECYGELSSYSSNVPSYPGVYDAEGTQYQLYSDNGVTTSSYSFLKKKRAWDGSYGWWWLRSPSANDSYGFRYVSSDGDWGNGDADNYLGGVSPSFCF